MPHFEKDGKEGIVVVEHGATAGEQFEQLEGRRFAEIVDILFIGHAKQKDFGALDGFAAIVERGGDRVHHVVRHRSVHFTR